MVTHFPLYSKHIHVFSFNKLKKNIQFLNKEQLCERSSHECTLKAL